MNRFFVPPALLLPGQCVNLPATVAHQLVSVLRVRVGDQIALLDGLGSEYPAVVEAVSRREVAVRVGAGSLLDTEPTLRLSLYPSLLKGERFDFVLQKGTEVGVSRFVPTVSERSVARPAEGKGERWQRIVQEAAEQSHRARVPTVAEPLPFAAACADALTADLTLILWEEERTASLRDVLGRHQQTYCDPAKQASPPSVALLIGPEGGYSAEEVQTAGTFGIIPVSLGRRILRAETAAVVAATLVLAVFAEIG